MNIAITGAGIVSAIGCRKAEVLKALREGQSGVGPVRHLPTVHRELPVGEVRLSDVELKQALGISEEEAVSRTVLMGTLAAREALEEARLDTEVRRSRRVVLLSGTTVGGMDLTERQFLANGADAAAKEAVVSDCGASTEEIARRLRHIAQSATISTACSAAANAVIVGAEMLRTGEADVVVAGGSEALSLFHLNGFNALMILDAEPCRPFCATRAGLNLGEGAAYVVLERADEALERGAEIEAYVAGTGNACDAFHQTATSPTAEGPYRAMTAALAEADLNPTDIAYVNAHGTGTSNNDETELAALRRVFGAALPPVSSTKSFTGHTTSASGSIELVVSLLAMKEGFIPANLFHREPLDGFTPSKGEAGMSLPAVMTCSFGFGGNDSAIVLTAAPRPAAEGKESAAVAGHNAVLSDELLSDEAALSGIREFMSPMEARRMGKLLKAALLTSLRALKKADIAEPDAIVTATTFGCADISERILTALAAEGESGVSPTLFMQSTHNTVSSTVAMKLRAHGYNITFTGGEAFADAWAEARRLLRLGRARTVLINLNTETTPLMRAHLPGAPALFSRSIVLARTD